MTEDDEVKSIDRLVDELGRRFPGVPTPVVQRVVTDRYHQFDGAPIRDYIPVLVRRSANESLVSMVDDSRSRFGRNF